jgi:hypothetical protein
VNRLQVLHLALQGVLSTPFQPLSKAPPEEDDIRLIESVFARECAELDLGHVKGKERKFSAWPL